MLDFAMNSEVRISNILPKLSLTRAGINAQQVYWKYYLKLKHESPPRVKGDVWCFVGEMARTLAEQTVNLQYIRTPSSLPDIFKTAAVPLTEHLRFPA